MAGGAWCVCVYICVCLCVSLCVYLCVSVSLYVYLCVSVCCVCLCVYPCVLVGLCMCVYMCVVWGEHVDDELSPLSKPIWSKTGIGQDTGSFLGKNNLYSSPPWTI